MFKRMMFNRTISTAALATGLGAMACAPAHAQSAVEKFYKGRNVTIVIGASMGGSYGMYSQLTARHLGKHIPGNPNFVVQSKPGAGGVVALNYLYNVAPKDGSVMAIPASAVVFETVLNDKAQFDATKFHYIGRLVNTDLVGLIARRTGITSLDQLKTKSVAFGGSGVRNGLSISAQLINRVAGTKIKIITGYRGLGPIFKAIEGKEIDGMSSTVVSPKYLEFMAKYKKGEPTDLVPVYAASLERLPDLPDVPSLGDMKPDEKTQGFAQLFASQGFIGRSLAFPPGVPEEFVAAYRKGFQAMLKDAEFRKDIEKSGIPLAAMDGPTLQKKIAGIVQANPKAKVAETRQVYKEIIAGIQASSKK